MPGMRRDLPHLYLRGRGSPESYISKYPPPQYSIPQRDRAEHAQLIRDALDTAFAHAEIRRSSRDPDTTEGRPGSYFDFEIHAGSEIAVDLLENRQKGIELITVRQEAPAANIVATIFVPDSAAAHFLKKVEAYRSEDTKKGNPKCEALIARIDSVTLAAVRSLYTDTPALFPSAGEQIWWEVWIRRGHGDFFDSLLRRLNIRAAEQRLTFPEREVRLIFADEAMMARLFLNSDAIAELRLAKDSPALFVDWSNLEQSEWATDLAGRLIVPEHRSVAVCVLDTGVTRVHPLLAPVLDADDAQVYDPTWSVGDVRGHGTNMGGVTVYGDLTSHMANSGPVLLTHVLESVKILPDQGENNPKLYGAITGESIARAEIQAPSRRRAVCMAVTSNIGGNRGRPSSWSAAIDQLCFGDDTARRLIILSAGNIRDGLSKANYPNRNESEPIENPAQAWNAITVGAYTEKTALLDPGYADWEPIAPAGDLSPASRTSLTWDRQWPLKPDVVLEGGNWASLGDQCDCPDDLGILTTYHNPSIRHFDIFRDTSAATAMAGNLAGKLLAAMPERWPETIRALIIHSAEWSPIMRAQFHAATSEQQKRALLRKYGYGIPSFERAMFSAANDLTLIAEDEIQPFIKDGSTIRNRHMNLHTLPWPRTELEQLGEADVELRITLSYYVEPNPGERGWLRKHRYPSHAFRFQVNRPLETLPQFRTRINKAAVVEEQDFGTIDTGPDNWDLGRIRNVGSIHSDYWRGPAVDLAKRSLVAVYPIGGWWKENPQHHRYDHTARYALIVSLRAVNSDVDIYTPVRLQITVPVPIALN
jgi:hypothetical protein